MATDMLQFREKVLASARARMGIIAPLDAPEFDRDPDGILFDYANLDGGKIMAEYEQEMACYATTPFDPDGRQLRLYPGGVTVWSGYPGAGKTTLLRQLACHLLQRDNGVFFASLEENPKHLLARLACTAAGTRHPNAHQAQWFIDAYNTRLRIWGKTGITKHRDLLAVVRMLAKRDNVKHAFIDSLMKLDIPTQDFELQRTFANLLAATAQETGVHIHLVAHPRKASANTEIDTSEVGGARELGGIADNVLFVKRNDSVAASGDAVGMRIQICKQRHGFGSLGSVTGFFMRDLLQFHVEQSRKPTRYLPDDAYECSGPFTS